MFSLIVAHDANYGIGLDNHLPWHLSEDLKQFKEHTIHKKILMGKTTFDGFKKPLPERHTVVACFKGEEGENSELVTYCTDLIQYLKDNENTDEEIVVCGGASIYKLCLPYCKKLYISLVEGEHKVDTYFPKYNPEDYTVASVTPFEGFKVIEYIKK